MLDPRAIIQVGCPTCCYQVCALDHANVGTADPDYSSGHCRRNGHWTCKISDEMPWYRSEPSKTKPSELQHTMTYKTVMLAIYKGAIEIETQVPPFPCHLSHLQTFVFPRNCPTMEHVPFLPRMWRLHHQRRWALPAHLLPAIRLTHAPICVMPHLGICNYHTDTDTFGLVPEWGRK